MISATCPRRSHGTPTRGAGVRRRPGELAGPQDRTSRSRSQTGYRYRPCRAAKIAVNRYHIPLFPIPPSRQLAIARGEMPQILSATGDSIWRALFGWKVQIYGTRLALLLNRASARFHSGPKEYHQQHARTGQQKRGWLGCPRKIRRVADAIAYPDRVTRIVRGEGRIDVNIGIGRRDICRPRLNQAAAVYEARGRGWFFPGLRSGD